MFNKLKAENIVGLSEDEAAKKLAKDGYNQISSGNKRSNFSIIIAVLKEPMFLLLMSCGTIYLIMGDKQEALILLSFVFIVIGITFYQEHKAERTLEALQNLSSPRALVIRDGKERRISGREVVEGDFIVVSEGDRVPADSLIVSCFNLSVDESLLTGESLPVSKIAYEIGWGDQEEVAVPGGNNSARIYAGTMVVAGHAVIKTLWTGSRTEMGKVGLSLSSISPNQTALQKEIRAIVGYVSMIGFFLCIFIVVFYGVLHYDWLQGMLSGITLAMAILPEEFPMILTIFFVMGAWRMAQKKVLTRQISAIETLGSATVLCADKTGTITFNKLKATKIFAADEYYEIVDDNSHIPEKFHNLLEFSTLACRKNPFDPIELAMRDLGEKTLKKTARMHQDWIMVREYPITNELLAFSQVWKTSDEGGYFIAATGAPESIISLCPMSETKKEYLLQQVSLMAVEGLRVIGVAKSHVDKEFFPDNLKGFKFDFLGLIGLSDPVRPSVVDSITECYEAGIRVLMITGDYPGTAMNIAKKIGLQPDNIFITGFELGVINEDDLRNKIKEVNIFARVVPAQKLRLVEALRANGEVVAMTGDGVNDAPALKAADIGVAMGEKGSDVAREASDIVLLNDDFSSIVGSVKMGRKIYDNIKKAMTYAIAVHIPIAGISLLPVIFEQPLVLFPVHIAFLELIINPTCAIVFEAEPEETDVMKRPPRKTNENLFGKKEISVSFAQGIMVFGLTLSLFFMAIKLNYSHDAVRTMTFATLLLCNLSLIFSNRSWARSFDRSLKSANKAFYWVAFATISLSCLIYFVPFIRSIFHFGLIDQRGLFLCFSAGLLSIFMLETFKFIKYVVK